MAKKYDIQILNSIALRAHYLATQMIHIANNRPDKIKGDPKVGGHPAASASSLHILGALHLVVKSGFDHIAVKPHASPTDHSYNFLMNLLLDSDHNPLSEELSIQAMHGLRAFSKNGEPVFQSYHSHYDPDHHNFFPSGTVGIPPVKAGYLAHAYRFAKNHGYEVPKDAHFWSLIGDSEYREGSLYEAIPDFAEREIGNLTWIVDYNRQSLDGHRITNKKIMNGTDDLRIERTAVANGWEVIQVRHGQLRQKLFAKKGGEVFKKFLENELEDYELQALLLFNDVKGTKKELLEKHPQLKEFLSGVTDQEIFDGLRDMGGHDFNELIEAMEKSKLSKNKPTLIIAHTIKGWGLKNAATAGNHSSLPSAQEVDELREKQGITHPRFFQRFDSKSKEGQFLKTRGEQLLSEIHAQHELREKNKSKFLDQLSAHGEFPTSMNINTKLVTYPHTQWMLGQLTAKLTRVANTSAGGGKDQKPLTQEELILKGPGELLVSMAPDVGTSTNLNPAMDGKVFGANTIEDFESELNVRDTKTPDLLPGEEASDRFLRFEIAEGNVMSCVGSYGQMRDLLGIPLVPLMTVYDFFVKRALDQLFYNLYWKSSFILVGTPAGVTLSPEGAQHGWKSDIQIPNQITWEPFFCIELDWIMTDSIRRHLFYDNQGRSGVFIRGSTRGIDQNVLLQRLKRQQKFKMDPSQLLHAPGFALPSAVEETQVEARSEGEILETLRHDVLAGGYYLIDYRGYAGYEPGDNVIHILSMGSPTTEAIEASDKLLEKGIYANVIVVTSPDLLVGNLAHENNYDYLKNHLGIDGSMFLHPYSNGAGPTSSAGEVLTLAGRRVPIVSVHDGEPGLLDNIGSIVGVRHEALSIRKHSKCGRPDEVYAFHGIDSDSIVEAAGQVLSETAVEKIQLSRRLFSDIERSSQETLNWRSLWPLQKD